VNFFYNACYVTINDETSLENLEGLFNETLKENKKPVFKILLLAYYNYNYYGNNSITIFSNNRSIRDKIKWSSYLVTSSNKKSLEH
jgi:hypothetical protein